MKSKDNPIKSYTEDIEEIKENVAKEMRELGEGNWKHEESMDNFVKCLGRCGSLKKSMKTA